MKPFPSSLLVLCLLCGGCGGGKSKERRELERLEVAIGMVAGAEPADRSIRLEQLQNLRVETEKVNGLKALCLSSYTTFDKASRFLAEAKNETGKIETEIAAAKERKRLGVNLSPEEAERLITMGRKATISLEQVTLELDQAERLVADCEEQRLTLRAEIMAQ